VGTELEDGAVGRLCCSVEIEVDSDAAGWCRPRLLQNPHKGPSHVRQFLMKKGSLDTACHRQIGAEPIREDAWA
jgi:hypothetical protein